VAVRRAWSSMGLMMEVAAQLLTGVRQEHHQFKLGDWVDRVPDLTMEQLDFPV
jgi:hypothetical protein